MNSTSNTLDVSRETLDRLKLYEQNLLKWTKKINIVAPSTMNDAWNRHFVDSAQVFDLRRLDAKKWLDLGSGGGFPGLVCATIASEKAPDLEFTFVESDTRKCAFLRSVARELDLKLRVLCDRIENIQIEKADVISARALSALPNLLQLSQRHGSDNCQYLFPKGQNWEEEVELARKKWQFSLTCHRSKTNTEAVILEIGNISNA